MSKNFVKIFFVCINFNFFFSVNKSASFHHIRNPFFPFKKEHFQKCEKKSFNSFNDSILLDGVLKCGNSFGAILKKGRHKQVVFVNDAVWGYQVKKITMNDVLIKKGGDEIRLSIE